MPIQVCRDCIGTASEDIRQFLDQHAVLAGLVRDPFFRVVPAADGDGLVAGAYGVEEPKS